MKEFDYIKKLLIEINKTFLVSFNKLNPQIIRYFHIHLTSILISCDRYSNVIMTKESTFQMPLFAMKLIAYLFAKY